MKDKEVFKDYDVHEGLGAVIYTVLSLIFILGVGAGIVISLVI